MQTQAAQQQLQLQQQQQQQLLQQQQAASQQPQMGLAGSQAQGQGAVAAVGNAVHNAQMQASQMMAPAAGVPKDGFFNVFFGAKDPQQKDVARTATAAAAAVTAVAKQPQPPAPATKGKQLSSGAAPLVGGSSAAPVSSASSAVVVSSGGGRTDRLEQVPASIRALSAPSDKERFETELIQALLVAYFDIVRKNVKDLVPKSIMYFLVSQSKESIQNELVTSLYKEELFLALLEESPMVASRRNACKSMLEVLRRAHEILNEVRDFSTK